MVENWSLKVLHGARQWWRRPLIPALKRQSQVVLCEFEVKARPDTGKSCWKTKQNKKSYVVKLVELFNHHTKCDSFFPPERTGSMEGL